MRQGFVRNCVLEFCWITSLKLLRYRPVQEEENFSADVDCDAFLQMRGCFRKILQSLYNIRICCGTMWHSNRSQCNVMFLLLLFNLLFCSVLLYCYKTLRLRRLFPSEMLFCVLNLFRNMKSCTTEPTKSL